VNKLISWWKDYNRRSKEKANDYIFEKRLYRAASGVTEMYFLLHEHNVPLPFVHITGTELISSSGGTIGKWRVTFEKLPEDEGK